MTKSRKKHTQVHRNKVTLAKLSLHKLSWLEHLTILIGLWFLFFPKPYVVLFTILLCMPIIGILLNNFNGRPSIASLVEVKKDNKGSDKYDVADFIDFPAWIILLRVLMDFEFESFNSMIIPGTIAFALMLIILFMTHKLIEFTTKSKTWIYLSLISNVFLYSYAGTYGVNCVYDNSEAIVYNTDVIHKRIYTGRRGRKKYLLKVTPWGTHNEEEEISVPSSQYDNIKIGQTIKIDLKKGLLNIPWYYVER